MAEAIKNGNGGAVNDGSYKPHFGTSAAIVKDMKIPGPEIVGLNAMLGDPSCQSACCSELAGIATSTTTVEMLCQVHNITEGSMIVALDGQIAMIAVSQPWDPKPSAPDFDLIDSIRRRVKRLPITINWEHVKGHQDDNRAANLSPLAKLSVQADSYAKQHYQNCHTVPMPNHKFGREPFTVHFQGKKLSKFDPKEFYNKIVGAELKKYWQKKHSIPAQLIDSIDWVSQQKARANLPEGKRRFFGKFATGFCGMGKMLKIRKCQDHSECPLCQCILEDNQHILCCPDL